MNSQTRRPTIDELRAVSQPESVRGRQNAEHWSGEYLRHGSLYVTRLLVPTRITPNGVTGVMIMSGWCIAISLIVPGIWGPLLAVFFAQLQMYLDCVDGELARWRQKFSPAGIFLDRVAHYTTEGFIGLAFGLRAIGWGTDADTSTADSWKYAFLGAVLMGGILVNKALNDMVHVARALSGAERLPDTSEAKAVPRRSLIGLLRSAARFLPFHRIFHSVELSILALVVAIVGLVLGHGVEIFQYTVWVLAPAVWIVVVGHFVAIMASPRVRAS
ncbi:CDP-alcohol phosphatidyltransferase family protein [Demetria terragena]|uniref:CDP-alcohol phosphatidyltransferase family protein n=1 Tax=Demetria terragena TaxID=63959 RepID=UPI00035D08F8|nr:CDP-alcohol phosphatidyltransferase family protein [Demetria terragena]